VLCSFLASSTCLVRNLLKFDYTPKKKGNRNFRSHVLSLQGTKVPYVELSFFGTSVPWSSHSQELSFPGTFAPLSKNEVEISLLTQS